MRAWTTAFALGIALASLAPRLPPPPVPLLLCAAAVLAMGVARLRLAAAYVLGLGWALWWGQQGLAQRLPAELERQDIWVTGHVVSLPQRDSRSQRFRFKVERLCSRAELAACNFDALPPDGRLLRLSNYQEWRVAPGQRWRLQVRLKRPHGFANPGGFDYEAWLLREGIDATGYIRPAAENRLLAQGGLSLTGLRHAFRRWLDQRASSDDIPWTLPQAGLIKALTIGDRYTVTRDQWALFTATGTNHLMVISGLHVGLVAALAYRGACLLMSLVPGWLLTIPSVRPAAAAAVLAAFGYSALAGFSLPTRRAFIMVLALMVGRLLGRNTAPLNAFCLAVAAVLALDPLAVQAAGFWLSFGAVAVLIGLLMHERPPVPAQATGARRGGLRALFKAQLWLFVGMLPLMGIFFHQTSLMAPLVNLAAVPLVGLLVVPLCLVGLLLAAPWPAAAVLALAGADRLLSLLLALLEAAAGLLPEPLLALPALPLWARALLMAGVALLLWGRGARCKSAGLLCCLPLLWPHYHGPPHGAFRLHVLDVGQGLGVVVETERHRLIYDTGPAYSPRFDAGNGIVLPFLQAGNLGRVATVLVSHGDMDHAGGLPAIRERDPGARYLASAPDIVADDQGGELCRRGQRWRWDGVDFAVLHPADDAYRGNDTSCVLRISSGDFAALLPGDIERRAESALVLRQSGALAAQILVAPHHGSKTSSSADFIDAVAPEYVVFPAGYLSRFGHPHAGVRARYRERNVHTYNTAHTGALRFDVDPRAGIDGPRMWREERKRYWSRMGEGAPHD